jgi:hypothetical protein
MATVKDGTIRNGKIHPSRIRLLAGEASSVLALQPTARSKQTMRTKMAKRVRDLAHRERTSEKAIVDCALWHFFDSGKDAEVTALMAQAGIVPRRRRA